MVSQWPRFMFQWFGFQAVKSINSQWQVGYATLEVTATYSLAIADASPRPFVCQCCLVVVARGLERGVVIKHKK